MAEQLIVFGIFIMVAGFGIGSASSKGRMIVDDYPVLFRAILLSGSALTSVGIIWAMCSKFFN